MAKAGIGSIAGAAGGYYFWKTSPILGAAIGFFVGRMIGQKMDKAEAVKAEQAALAKQLEQQGGPT